MAINNDLYDLNSDFSDSDSTGSHNDIHCYKQFGNPMYESCLFMDNNPDLNDNPMDNTAGISDHELSTSPTEQLIASDSPGVGGNTGADDPPVPPVVMPKPRERTTIRRQNKALVSDKKSSVYANVAQNCQLSSDQTPGHRITCDNNHSEDIKEYKDNHHKNPMTTTTTLETIPTDDIPGDELPTLIHELEAILMRMNSDSFYATPTPITTTSTPTQPTLATEDYRCSPPPPHTATQSSPTTGSRPLSSPPPTLPPKVKPRRSAGGGGGAQASSSSNSPSPSSSTGSSIYRPLPKPPTNVPPPKPPHLPPVIPPPPPPPSLSTPPASPTTDEQPVIPPRLVIKEQVLRDNVDLEDQHLNHRRMWSPMSRKLSEPMPVSQPKVPIVDPYVCQHSDCRLKGIARSQTFRSSGGKSRSRLQAANNHSNINPNARSIIQKCGYLWKTGSNRREFLDRWCVLHRNDQQPDDGVLAYYADRKTTAARGKIMLKDVAFARLVPELGPKTRPPTAQVNGTINSANDSSNWCYFEIGTNCKRGRVFLFAAKCLSDQRLWFQVLQEAIAWDRFTLKDTFHCGYIWMKYGISGQWLVNYVLLSDRQITVVSKDTAPDEDQPLGSPPKTADNKSVRSSDNDSDSYVSTGSSTMADCLGSGHCYRTYDMRKVMSCGYASAHQINSCGLVHESGQPVCLTFPNKVLYIQCEYKAHTELWYQSFMKLWTVPAAGTLEDQYLTGDGVPVAVDKCINFVATYGTDTPNLYLQQNLGSPVAQAIVDELRRDAWALQLRVDNHSVHDITCALILYLKSMSECILTEKLYHNWIKANEEDNRNERLQKLKILLHLLPIVNYLTLKKLIAHIVCIIEQSDKNQTSILNIAPAICPALLFLKCCHRVLDDRVSTFDGHSAGIDIVTDLIQSYGWLFDVTAEELEKERRIQRALELLNEAKRREMGAKAGVKSVAECQEFLIGVYVYSREWGKCLNVRLTPTMTARELIEYVVKKANIKDNADRLSVYEIVYNEQLERPVHHTDIVLAVTLSWVKWSQQYSRDNYLCVRTNTLYNQLAGQLRDQTPITIFSELRYADHRSKGFKKVLVEFIGARLSVYKPDGGGRGGGDRSLGQWCVEDITWYLGAERKRRAGGGLGASKRWFITFIDRNNPIVKTKEMPYFGRVLCCNTEEEYHKWIAGMLCAEYPNGVIVNGINGRQTDLMD